MFLLCLSFAFHWWISCFWPVFLLLYWFVDMYSLQNIGRIALRYRRPSLSYSFLFLSIIFTTLWLHLLLSISQCYSSVSYFKAVSFLLLIQEHVLHCSSFALFKKIIDHFWLHWVFVALHRLFLVVSSGGHFSLPCVGFSLPWFLSL